MPSSRKKSRILRDLLVLLAMLVVGILYYTPQFLHQREGKPGAVVLSSSEVEAAHWFNEHVSDPNIALNASRGVLPALGVAALIWALRGFGFTLGFSILIAVWVYADPGLLAYHPLVHWYSPTSAGLLPLNRVFDPLLGLLVFFLGLGSTARALSAPDRRRGRFAWVAGACLGGLTYLNPPYWSHLAAIVVLGGFLSRKREAWKPVAMTLGLALILALPSLSSGLMFSSPDLLSRSLPRELAPMATTANFAFWLMVVFSAAILIQLRSFSSRLLLASIAAGVVGLLLADVRWNLTLAPLVFVAFFWALREFVQWNRLIASYHWTLRAAALCLLLMVLDSGFRATFAFYYQLPQ